MQLSSDRRTKSFGTWAGTIALVGLLLSVATGFIAIGRRDAAIDQKVDQTQYERDIGQIKGDIRVIRSALCGGTPAACQQ